MRAFELDCIRDQTIRHFKGTYLDDGSEIRFILEDEEHNQQTEGYIIDFTIINLDASTMRVQHMCIDIDKYQGIGIPDALIIKANELFGKQIISSTNSRINGNDDVNECITDKAKKVWKRLVCRKLAYYDSEAGRYKTFSPQTSNAGHALNANIE